MRRQWLTGLIRSNPPVIGTNISAIPEVLGKDHLLLAEPGNPDSFANKFGGLGIYKRKLFDSSDYTKLNLESCIYREHVDFHHSCVALGYSLYINPRLINSHWNIYNRHRVKMLRLARNVTRRSKTISRLIRAV
jgi:hypothetical protein